MNRLERISAILVRLQSGGVITARRLAGQFGVSLRTIYRDIRVLEESGIPISGEAGTGYSLVEGFRLPPLMFTTDEAVAFLLAEKLVCRQADGDIHELYRRGMDKIRAVLKAADKTILEDLSSHVSLLEGYSRPKQQLQQVLSPLTASILARRPAVIEYRAGYNGETTTREIEPLGIFFMTDQWYLLAWCRLRNDYRTFNLGRIGSITPAEEGFSREHPPLDLLLPTLCTSDDLHRVRLRVTQEGLRNMGATRYLFGLQKETEQGETVVQEYATFSLEYFGRWYLSFADMAVIEEPGELKTVVRNLIANIVV